MSTRLPFVVENRCPSTSARAGRLRTLHREVETPIFMPVATNAAIRGVCTDGVRELDAGILLANTYHLMVRPGIEVFKRLGGIHRLMNWPGGVLTDSGGFQLFSLSNSFRVEEEGAKVRSYVDGSAVFLSPESSIEMQRAIGSDIMMVLDKCIDSKSDHRTSKEAVELSARWAKRSAVARGDSPQALFGIVQGACFPDLRRESAERTLAVDLDGYAIGGLAVGETRAEREDITELTAALLPAERPRYLMGVGMPIDLLEAVKRGVDMFDCIIPSALALQGVCFSSTGRINLVRGVYRVSEESLDRACGCTTCRSYSRAYLRHLVKSGEWFGAHLLGIHNIAFYLDLMRRIRAAIVEDRFAEFYASEKPKLTLGDEENPPRPPVRRRRSSRLSMGGYEIVIRKGAASIKHLESGEVMHPVDDPLTEAEELYVEQSDLLSRVRQEARELVIWDVGMGAGTNAMAAILAYENLVQAVGNLAPLRIVSFENDLDSLRLALRHPSLFRHLRHQAPGRLLKNSEWRSNRASISWELRHGDFLETYRTAEVPELIFYDPFSYKTDSPLWQHGCFQGIADHCGEGAASLFTYSVSTAARAALLASGFFVAEGRATGPKRATTIAYTAAAAPRALLDRRFLERWERSDAKYPSDVVADGDRERFASLIRNHPQFKV